MAHTPPLYQLDNLTHRYGGQVVLTIDRLTLSAGAILGLCGPNGSGKSTLLKLLGFLERPAGGTIQFEGRPAAPFDERVRVGVALLPQASYLLRRSVYNNVAYGLRIRKDRRDETARVHHALATVGLAPQRFAQRPWFALSGGEARRVALAARLVLQPRVLLLDEPTTSVDSASAQLIKEAALQAHRAWGTSLIIAGHDQHWLAEICHDTLDLFRGRLLGRGKRTLLFGPWHDEADGLTAMPLDDNQRFLAAGRPKNAPAAVAAIDARHLGLYLAPHLAAAHQCLLEGTVIALGLEKASQQVSVCLAVGQTRLTAFIPREALADGQFIPGSRAWIAYSPQQVQWY